MANIKPKWEETHRPITRPQYVPTYITPRSLEKAVQMATDREATIAHR